MVSFFWLPRSLGQAMSWKLYPTMYPIAPSTSGAHPQGMKYMSKTAAAALRAPVSPPGLSVTTEKGMPPGPPKTPSIDLHPNKAPATPAQMKGSMMAIRAPRHAICLRVAWSVIGIGPPGKSGRRGMDPHPATGFPSPRHPPDG